MLTIDRQRAVLEYIQEHHSATVTEMSKRFFISETSIRRDLARLEKAGLIRKTYGGAVLVDGNNEVLSLVARQQVESESKIAIARKAAALVSNGQIIFMDSSSTVLSMVPFLSHLQNLSIITTSLKTAAMLMDYPQLKVYIVGGLLNPRTFSISGSLTCQMLGDMYANMFFVSPRGVDESGTVFLTDEEEAATRRMMMKHSNRNILLCSTSKLGQRSAFCMCNLQDINGIVCEAAPAPQWLELFEKIELQVY